MSQRCVLEDSRTSLNTPLIQRKRKRLLPYIHISEQCSQCWVWKVSVTHGTTSTTKLCLKYASKLWKRCTLRM